MIIEGLKTDILKNKFSVSNLIFDLENSEIKEKTIYVLSSKVVSLAEGRIPENDNFSEEVRKEGKTINKNEPYLTIRDGVFLPNAGIDRSNSEKDFSVLPKNPMESAKRICLNLKKLSGVKNLGIIISDSCVFPLRKGVGAIALGVYGFKATENEKQKKDLFGRNLEITIRNIADMLANAAAIEMGEGNEQKPFIRIRDVKVDFNFNEKDLELKISPNNCLFESLYPKDLKKQK